MAKQEAPSTLKTLDRVYSWLLLAPIVLPVVVWSGLIYPYLVPKTLLFYAIMLVALGIFLVLLTRGRLFYWGRLHAWETWLPAALLAIAYATSLIGIDFYRSFWSIFVRGDGLLMLTGVVASYYLIVLTADALFRTRFVRGVASVGTLVAVYGIGEWVLGGGRIGSLLGNAAFFAGYLGLSCFVTLIAAQSLRGLWKRAALGGALLQVIAIVLTATRGTLLALLVALLSALLFTAFRGTGKQRSWSRTALAALFVLTGLFVTFRAQLATVPFTPLARIASVSTTETDIASRLFIWHNMLGEVAKQPFTGVGAEHIDILFNRFYDPTQIVEQWFDRSHNAYLDYLAQYGIGGVLLYLGLIIGLYRVAWRLVRHGEPRIGSLALLLAVTYAVQNFFVFDTISSLWLFIAFSAVLLSLHDSKAVAEHVPLPEWMRPASWGIALLLVVLVYPVSVEPAIAAYDLAHAYGYQLADVNKGTAYLSHGYALSTYGDLEYGYEAYEMYTSTQATHLVGDNRVMAYQAAQSILAQNFARYTYDARTALYLANVLSLAPSGVSVDSGLLSESLARAIRLSPKRSQPWYILANLSISNANAHPPESPERLAGYAAARAILSQYITSVPTLSMPHFVLAQLLYASGDTTAAAQEAERGRLTYVRDLETATRAATYYETVRDLSHAAFFLAEVVQLDPTNTVAKGDLDTIQTYEHSQH